MRNLYRQFHAKLFLYLFWYSIAFNLLILVDLNYLYSLVNIFGNDFNKIPEVVIYGLLLVIFFAEFSIVYFLHLVVCRLKRRRSKRSFKIGLYVWLIAFFIATIVGIVLSLSDAKNTRPLYIIHASWIFSMISIILYSISSLIVHGHMMPEEKIRLRTVSFGYLYLISYLVFTLSHLDFYFLHKNIQDYDPLILTVINLVPIIWYHGFYKNSLVSGPSGDFVRSLPQEFVDEFNITLREKEVIEMVLQGKTNKEIEELLFISHNTVRNHLYNVYRKTGITRRLQLLNLVRKYSCKDSAEE